MPDEPRAVAVDSDQRETIRSPVGGDVTFYFDFGTVLRQLGVARDPASLGGRLGTVVSHPLKIGRGLVRRVIGR